MSFEAALVSFLHPSPANAQQTVLADPVLKIHSVQLFTDQPTALTALKVKAQEYLQKTYEESYVGVLDDTSKILAQKLGSYSLIISNDEVTVWFTGEKTISGWVSNSTAPAIFALGKFLLVPVENVMPELKAYVSELEQQGADAEDAKSTLESANRALQARVITTERETIDLRSALLNAESRSEEYRKSALAHAQECKRLKTELEISCKNASAELQKKMSDKDREMQSLREEAQYAVHNQQTPPRADTGNFAQNGFASCFASLASFDRNKLKNRQQRDALLAQKSVKTAPVIIMGGNTREAECSRVEYGELDY